MNRERLPFFEPFGLHHRQYTGTQLFFFAIPDDIFGIRVPVSRLPHTAHVDDIAGLVIEDLDLLIQGLARDFLLAPSDHLLAVGVARETQIEGRGREYRTEFGFVQVMQIGRNRIRRGPVYTLCAVACQSNLKCLKIVHAIGIEHLQSYTGSLPYTG